MLSQIRIWMKNSTMEAESKMKNKGQRNIASVNFRWWFTFVDGKSWSACGMRSLRAELSILKAKSILSLRELSTSSMWRRGQRISSNLHRILSYNRRDRCIQLESIIEESWWWKCMVNATPLMEHHNVEIVDISWWCMMDIKVGFVIHSQLYSITIELNVECIYP